MYQRGQLWGYTKQTLLEYLDDDGLRLSAALAFYSVLSLAPVLIFSLALAGVVWDTEPARLEVSRYVTEFAGNQAAEVFLSVLENASKSTDAQFATIAGIIVLVLGSTAVFAELQSGLNTIWKVKEPDQVRAFVRRRLVSAAIVFLVAGLLMLSVVAATIISFAASVFRTGSYAGETVWYVMQHATSFAVFTMVFAAMFKLLPSTAIPWRRVWGGAAFTALLFLVGKYLIRVYLEHASLESSYGAAGSVLAFLLWIYYSAIIFYLGAELTSVVMRRRSGDA